MTIKNSNFENVLSILENTIIYAITNPQSVMEISNSTFKNVFGEKSAIKLILSDIKVFNVSFYGVYSKMSANFISIMYSEVVLRNITFDNSFNDMGIR